MWSDPFTTIVSTTQPLEEGRVRQSLHGHAEDHVRHRVGGNSILIAAGRPVRLRSEARRMAVGSASAVRTRADEADHSRAELRSRLSDLDPVRVVIDDVPGDECAADRGCERERGERR